MLSRGGGMSKLQVALSRVLLDKMTFVIWS